MNPSAADGVVVKDPGLVLYCSAMRLLKLHHWALPTLTLIVFHC